MKKLTAEKCRELLEEIKYNRENCFLSGKTKMLMDIAESVILEQQERRCQKCGGTGMADSGGTQPWGEQILVECDCKLEQQERGDVPERQDSLKHVGYLFVNSGGGVVYSPSGFGMRGFTCAGKIYGAVSFQPERATNHNGEH